MAVVDRSLLEPQRLDYPCSILFKQKPRQARCSAMFVIDLQIAQVASPRPKQEYGSGYNPSANPPQNAKWQEALMAAFRTECATRSWPQGEIQPISFPAASRPLNPLSKVLTHCRRTQDRTRERGGETERGSEKKTDSRVATGPGEKKTGAREARPRRLHHPGGGLACHSRKEKAREPRLATCKSKRKKTEGGQGKERGTENQKSKHRMSRKDPEHKKKRSIHQNIFPHTKAHRACT